MFPDCEIIQSNCYCEASGFIKKPNGKIIYYSSEDYRWPIMGRTWTSSVLYRTAESEKDYHGGSNNFSDLEHFKENVEKLRQEVHKIFTYMALAYSNDSNVMRFVPIDRTYNNILLRDIEVFNNNPIAIDTERNPYRCGLGTGSASISYDGKIFSCQEQDSRDTSDYFYIGNIYDGIDIKKHSKILEDYQSKGIMVCEDKEKCDNCVLRRICIHENCPSVAYDMFKDFKIRPSIDCDWHRMLFEDALIVMKMMKEEDNQLFKDYLESCFSVSPKEKEEEKNGEL